MAGQYELKKFLRLVSIPILKEYFESIGWTPAVKWDELAAADVAPLFEAIRDAPDDTRARINRDFQQINALATEGGVRTLIAEGQHPARGKLRLAEELKDIAGLENKVFRVFLDHPSRDGRPSIFAVAKEFNRADAVPGRSWRKRSGVPEVTHAKSPNDEAAQALEAGRKRLEDSLQSYYRVKEGRGFGCRVHHFERENRLYWFAYVRDYDRVSMEWGTDDLDIRASKPVFEVIFVHSNANRLLDIFVKGDKDTVAELQELWALAVLGNDDLGTPPERGVEYELDGLKTKMQLPFRHEDGIKAVRVSALRLSLMGDRQNRRITLEANTKKDPLLVYALLDQVFRAPGQSADGPAGKDPRLSLDIVHVTQAVINFVFAADTRSGTQTIIARISYPNSCSLKYEPKEEIARKYLREWKIDVSQSGQPDPQGA